MPTGTRRSSEIKTQKTAEVKDTVTSLKEARRMSARKIAVVEMEAVADVNAVVVKNEDESAIFSVCASTEELEDSEHTELGDFELNYLHSLYQPTDILGSTADTILPDALAPPSLGGLVQMDAIPSSRSSTHSSSLGEEDEEENDEDSDQPNTPPRLDHTEWGADETNTLPSSPVKVPVKVTSGRKRKATEKAAESVTPPPPTKHARMDDKSHKRGSHHSCEEEEDDESDCESTCNSSSNHPTLDGLEIRPEDDPLGLFSRDPSTLTPEEQRLLKKQRRLLKNRESAQLSRHRKKMHLHSLEKQVDALKKEKVQLALRVQALLEDNERLRKQIISSV